MIAHFIKKRNFLSKIVKKSFVITFPYNLWLFSQVKKAFTIQVIYRKKQNYEKA
jgi:hypothetical protein